MQITWDDQNDKRGIEEGNEFVRCVVMAISNVELAFMMLKDENKNLERALTVLRYGDNDSKERIQELLSENDALKQELRKERETNDVLKKYMKRQDKFIAYLKETRNSWSEEKASKSLRQAGNKHSVLCRKRSSSIH